MCLLGIAILSRVAIIQFVQKDKWQAKAENYVQQIRPIDPARGQIYSSDGSLLATSVPEYEIRWDSKCEGLDMDDFIEKMDSISLGLEKILFNKDKPKKNKSKAEYNRIFENAIVRGNRYALIKKKVNFNQLQLLKELPILNRGRYKSGFVFDKKEIRKKPFGQLASRTIGIERSDHMVGLERAYNEQLAGIQGQQLKEKIAGNVWKPLTDEYIVEPVEGIDLISTIDIHLQDVAHSALESTLKECGAEWGCVVLMEVETGYVRAIANLDNKKDTSKYQEVFNYAIGQRVEPGSTFKLPAMMTALEDDLVELSDSIYIGDGKKKFFKKTIKDSNYGKESHKPKGTVENMFEWSSNVGLAEIIDQSYSDNKQGFLDRLRSFGICDSLGISITGAHAPIIYKVAKNGVKNWSGVSHVQMAMGYEIQYTPLQILAFYNAVANEGKLVRPLFASGFSKNGVMTESIEPVVLKASICSKETIKDAQKAMEGVCKEDGTAYYTFRNTPYKVAGKTGTAWIYENGSYTKDKYRASFVGYFPAENPKYSCIVVVHKPKGYNYYGSVLAAPVFKELADKIYSTQFEYRHVQEEEMMIAETKLPVSKSGSSTDLQTVFKNLNISTNVTSESDWARTNTGEDQVELNELKTVKGLVPKVIDMGLQDALYILENAGMEVTIKGHGTVKKQSVSPGTRINNNTRITIELG